MRTVEEVRRIRLLELKQRFGSYAEINRKLNRTVTDSTLSQIANASAGSKTNAPKTMGSPLARELEQTLELGHGYMDTDPDLLQAAPAWPLKGITPAQFATLDPGVIGMAEAVLLHALRSGEIASPRSGTHD